MYKFGASRTTTKKGSSLKLQINFDSHTYTKTKVFKPYTPEKKARRKNAFEEYYEGDDKSLTYWGKGNVGVEPIDFARTISILRENTVMSPYDLKTASYGQNLDLSTPYQNDLVTFQLFESARNELAHRAEHIAKEMKRVDDAWNTPPLANQILMNRSSEISGNKRSRKSHH